MIREITTADKEIFTKMAKEFYSSDAVLHVIPDEYHENAFNEAIKSHTYLHILMLEYDSSPVGYCTLSKQFATEAGGICIWFEDIYVRPQFRSKGLGRELFAYVENNFDYARLRLEVEDDNLRAVELYKRIGFEKLPYAQMIKSAAVDNSDKI